MSRTGRVGRTERPESSGRSGRIAARAKTARPTVARLATIRLTPRGWTFLAASSIAYVVAYDRGFRELLYVATLLLAIPLVSLLLLRLGRPRLSAIRTFSPHVVEAGSAADVTVVVRNLGRAVTVRARWSDVLPWHPGTTPSADLPALQPRSAGRLGDTAVLRYELRPPRRGVFDVGPLLLETADAFGMAIGRVVAGEPQQVTVTPEVVPLAETGLNVSSGDGESRLLQRRSAGDDDDAMTREYRSGDAMRRVHWRASARHGDLMVRQEEQRSFPEARVVLDTRRAGYQDEADGEDSASFEWAIRMLASVTVHLRRLGFLVTIVESGEPQLEPVSRGLLGASGDEEFLAALAAVHPIAGMVASGSAGTKGASGGMAGPLVAIVGDPDAGTVDWLLRQRGQGEVAVVFTVTDATSLDAFDTTFGLHADAPEIAARLAEAGWLVVPVRSDADHADAWDTVAVETGRARA